MSDLVLLVEDEEKTGNMLKKALESENISVEWAKDGKYVLEKVKKGNFDLIILDLKLPKITGEEILESIRESDPYIEVIVYTNYQDPPVMKKLINLGVEGYINKGSDANLWDAVETIKNHLKPFSKDDIEKLVNATPDGFLSDDFIKEDVK